MLCCRLPYQGAVEGMGLPISKLRLACSKQDSICDALKCMSSFMQRETGDLSVLLGALARPSCRNRIAKVPGNTSPAMSKG